MTVVKKFKLIEHLPQHFIAAIGPLSECNRLKAQLFYTIEYHKKKYGDKGNNVTRPHVHGVLTTNKVFGQGLHQSIVDYFNRKFGRTEFYLQEDKEEVEGWKEYCGKDVNINNEMYDVQHGFDTMDLQLNVLTDYEIEQIDIDDY